MHLCLSAVCVQLRLVYGGRMLTAEQGQQQLLPLPGVRVVYVVTRLEGG
jgi:hypothetical protein